MHLFVEQINNWFTVLFLHVLGVLLYSLDHGLV